MARSIRLLMLFATVLALPALTSSGSAAEMTAERDGEDVVVKIDGALFTRYIPDFNGTPILWPVIGPTQKPVTRAYPMGQSPGEREDHPHHRSIWFTHGDVNGLSFWHRDTIKHREYVKIESGPEAVIVTRNDWLSTEGKPVCRDERGLAFGSDGDQRWIDFDITITATEGAVTFGDTKEGTMGVRVAGTMKVDAGLGGKIVNSEGQSDGDAWGRRAAWVDYHGPVDGQTVGVAVLNHPSSYGYPTFWHVRTYGLFAANPFGLHDFLRSREVNGSLRLDPGESFSLRYRLLFHKGDEKAGRVAEAFDAYAKQKK
jgi:hypothetical protein